MQLEGPAASTLCVICQAFLQVFFLPRKPGDMLYMGGLSSVFSTDKAMLFPPLFSQEQ